MNIITLFYIKCFLTGLIGCIISTMSVMYSLTKKSKAANLQFNLKTYLKSDWFAPAISILGVLLGLLFLGPAIAKYPALKDSRLFILIFFSALGYSGNDAISRFFSVVTSKLNQAIDYKTNIADAQTGTLNTPTPAK